MLDDDPQFPNRSHSRLVPRHARNALGKSLGICRIGTGLLAVDSGSRWVGRWRRLIQLSS
jgi:hypothetical protein